MDKGLGAMITECEKIPGIRKWERVNEQILLMEVVRKTVMFILIVVYGPREDKKQADEEGFGQTFQEICDRRKSKLIFIKI